jgi:hypothetical protein
MLFNIFNVNFSLKVKKHESVFLWPFVAVYGLFVAVCGRSGTVWYRPYGRLSP